MPFIDFDKHGVRVTIAINSNTLAVSMQNKEKVNINILFLWQF